MFGLVLSEEVRCPQCAITSHQVGQHVEHYLIMSAAGLRDIAMISGG